MIDLPTLGIVRNELHEVRLVEKARARIEADNALRDEGIHASDLLDPRRAYWKYVDPKPLSEREVWLFLIGKLLHHFVIISHTSNSTANNTTDLGTQEVEGILFSPDMEDDDACPIELKTNRSFWIPPEAELQTAYYNYLEQLAIYMVLRNTLVGHLWILHINLRNKQNTKTYPDVRCYTITIPQDKFNVLQQNIFLVRDQLSHALETKDPTNLPLCRQWLCGDSCPWWNVCKPPGRYNTQKRFWSKA